MKVTSDPRVQQLFREYQREIEPFWKEYLVDCKRLGATMAYSRFRKRIQPALDNLAARVKALLSLAASKEKS